VVVLGNAFGDDEIGRRCALRMTLLHYVHAERTLSVSLNLGTCARKARCDFYMLVQWLDVC